MEMSFSQIALAAHLAVVFRVLTYRRARVRHRRHAAWIAWALMAVAGGSSIELALGAAHAGFSEAATAALLAVFVFGARGNVARLLQSDQS